MHRNLPRLTLALAGAAFALALVACDQEHTTILPSDQTTGITVEGLGEVTGDPDTGFVDLGISVQRVTVAEAREAAATAARAVIDSATANGVEERDIQTVNFSIYPVYDYPSNGQPVIRGYTVDNTVNIRVRDLDVFSDVIDDAAEAGGDATRISGIRFDIDDNAPLVVQAREAAMSDARAKAEQLADLADVSLGAPLNIVETQASEPPPELFAGAREVALADIPTPIQPGSAKVTVRVTVRWAIES
ncbi:MAG: SIMPL domain-containing protein [Dehalococcoidia bacterium]